MKTDAMSDPTPRPARPGFGLSLDIVDYSEHAIGQGGGVQAAAYVEAKTEDGRKSILGMQAIQRIGEPADVGPVVAFLASDHARWITGDTIRVDGGSKL